MPTAAQPLESNISLNISKSMMAKMATGIKEPSKFMWLCLIFGCCIALQIENADIVESMPNMKNEAIEIPRLA